MPAGIPRPASAERGPELVRRDVERTGLDRPLVIRRDALDDPEIARAYAQFPVAMSSRHLTSVAGRLPRKSPCSRWLEAQQAYYGLPSGGLGDVGVPIDQR